MFIYFFYTMLDTLLQEYGLSKTEAQSYLAILELGAAPVSSIARRSGENRVTVYSALKNLVKKWLATQVNKKNTTYYSVIWPDMLIKKLEDKYHMFKEALPQFLAIANKYDNKPKVQFFDGIEWLKVLYEEVILSGKIMPIGEPFLTFVGTSKIDSRFQEYLSKEFVPWRLKHPTKTRVIAAKSTSKYAEYNIKSHESIVIDDPVFDFANEIIIYGNDKVAILMYNTNELCGLTIESTTLHNGLKSMFNLIRKLAKRAKK